LRFFEKLEKNQGKNQVFIIKTIDFWFLILEFLSLLLLVRSDNVFKAEIDFFLFTQQGKDPCSKRLPLPSRGKGKGRQGCLHLQIKPNPVAFNACINMKV